MTAADNRLFVEASLYRYRAGGRWRGGLSTKIHTLVDALGNPVGFHLTGGEGTTWLVPTIACRIDRRQSIRRGRAGHRAVGGSRQDHGIPPQPIWCRSNRASKEGPSRCRLQRMLDPGCYRCSSLPGPNFLRCIPVRPEGRDHLVGASPTRAMVGWPGRWQAVWSGNRPDRSPATNVASGGGANRRAVTCVKPEQASKGKLWTPTRPEFGEGSTDWGSSRRKHPDRSTGVMGTARRDRGSRKRGRSALGEGSNLNGAARHRLMRKSDRVIVPPKPGNAGGGKGPDFWCVFEANEVR